MLEATLKKFPDHGPLWWYLGGIYRELDRHSEALRCYRRAVETNPRSERASLGLFHALWDLDQVEEALAEIKRFQLLTDWSCKDYLQIMKELHKEWVAPKKTKKKPAHRS